MPTITFNYGHYTYWEDYNPPVYVGNQKVTFDGPNKLILINEGETEIDVQEDIYSNWKEWMLQTDNAKYLEAISTTGGDPITGTESLGITFFLENGWRISPWPSYNGYILTIIGNLYTREEGGNPVNPESGVSVSFTRSSLVQLVTVETGGSGGGSTAEDIWTYNNRTLTSSSDPTVSEITDGVWNATASTYMTSGTTGKFLNDMEGQIRRHIYIDTEAVTNGSGYQQSPYNNVTDAIDDAENSGITRLIFLSDAVLDRNLKNFEIFGIGHPEIDCNGQQLDKSEFHDVELSGTMSTNNKGIRVYDCQFRNNFSGFDGEAFNVGFQGNFTFGSGTTSEIIGCYSAVAGSGRPTINSGGGSSNLSIRDYRGGANLGGVVSGDNVTFSAVESKITLLASNTGGFISIRGHAQFTDNSAGAIVDLTALVDTEQVRLAQELLEADQSFDQSAGLLHYYRKGTTVDLIPPKTVVTNQTQDTSLTE